MNPFAFNKRLKDAESDVNYLFKNLVRIEEKLNAVTASQSRHGRTLVIVSSLVLVTQALNLAGDILRSSRGNPAPAPQWRQSEPEPQSPTPIGTALAPRHGTDPAPSHPGRFGQSGQPRSPLAPRWSGAAPSHPTEKCGNAGLVSCRASLAGLFTPIKTEGGAP